MACRSDERIYRHRSAQERKPDQDVRLHDFQTLQRFGRSTPYQGWRSTVLKLRVALDEGRHRKDFATIGMDEAGFASGTIAKSHDPSESTRKRPRGFVQRLDHYLVLRSALAHSADSKESHL